MFIMTAEEFLLEKYNNCVSEESEFSHNVMMYYDPIYIRKKKINLIGSPKEIKFVESYKSKMLFYKDYKTKTLEIHYEEVWRVLRDKYNMNYDNIVRIIKKLIFKYENEFKYIEII